MNKLRYDQINVQKKTNEWIKINKHMNERMGESTH